MHCEQTTGADDLVLDRDTNEGPDAYCVFLIRWGEIEPKYIAVFDVPREPDFTPGAAPNVDTTGDIVECPVLVSIGELIDQPEIVELRPVRAVVRLKALDQIPCLDWDALQRIRRSLGVTLLIEDDRKRGPNANPIFVADEQRQLIGQVVEASPDISDSVAEHCSDVVGRGAHLKPEEEVARSLWVAFLRGAIWLSPLPGVVLLFEVTDMFLSPLEFEEWAVQWMRHEVSSLVRDALAARLVGRGTIGQLDLHAQRLLRYDLEERTPRLRFPRARPAAWRTFCTFHVLTLLALSRSGDPAPFVAASR